MSTEQTITTAKLGVGPEVIGTYKRLNYSAWYALAEFVDNSTQSYFNHKLALDKSYSENGVSLTVDIQYLRAKDMLIIKDNSYGMLRSELEDALYVGAKTPREKGRSKYGLGLKTAACWFGDHWTIRTSQLHSDQEFFCEVDVQKIVETPQDDEIKIVSSKAERSQHYTTITISRLHKKIEPKTLGKIKDFLSMFYNRDFKKHQLNLKLQGKVLEWDGYEESFYRDSDDDSTFRRNFSFDVGSANEPSKVKKVEGYVTVMFPGGSREKAGFVVYVEDRVIQGPPASYKPSTIFGREGGRNDVLNQRIFGELNLTNFEVSHTKDAIVWEGNDEEEVEKKLKFLCKEAIDLARKLRLKDDERDSYVFEDGISRVIPKIKNDLVSDDFHNIDSQIIAYRGWEDVLKTSIKERLDLVADSTVPFLEVVLDTVPKKVTVKLFAVSDSMEQPYLFVHFRSDPDLVSGVVNVDHPYVAGIKTDRELEFFMRNCIYDAVAEWKCRSMYGEIKSNIFRYLKDTYMRIPYIVNGGYSKQ